MNYNCKRATELLSDSMHRKLTRTERIGLWLHMLICSACRRWRRQVNMIRKAMRDSNETMPADMRERIAGAIHRHAES